MFRPFYPPCLQRAQTTPPFIERVSTTAADGVPRGMVDRTQTIDVYGSPTITSGGFRLTYGGEDSDIITPCIPGDSMNLTAEAISRALTSVNEFFDVTVEEDDQPFDGGRRFAVYFHEPEVGLGVLSVAPEDEDCTWIKCSSEADDGDKDARGDGGCEDSGVVINRDKSVFVQEGVIEVCGLRFVDEKPPRFRRFLVTPRENTISSNLYRKTARFPFGSLVQNAPLFNRYRSSSIQSTRGPLTNPVIHGAFTTPPIHLAASGGASFFFARSC